MDFWSTIRNCFCKSELNLLCCWEQKVHFGNWDDWSLVRHQYWLCEFSFSNPPGNWFPQPELQDYRSTVLQSVFVSPFAGWTWIKQGSSEKSQPSIITLGAILQSDLENFYVLWLWTAQSTNKMHWFSCKQDLSRWTCWAIMQTRTYNFLKTMPSFSQCHF